MWGLRGEIKSAKTKQCSHLIRPHLLFKHMSVVMPLTRQTTTARTTTERLPTFLNTLPYGSHTTKHSQTKKTWTNGLVYSQDLATVPLFQHFIATLLLALAIRDNRHNTAQPCDHKVAVANFDPQRPSMVGRLTAVGWRNVRPKLGR